MTVPTVRVVAPCASPDRPAPPAGAFRVQLLPIRGWADACRARKPLVPPPLPLGHLVSGCSVAPISQTMEPSRNPVRFTIAKLDSLE